MAAICPSGRPQSELVCMGDTAKFGAGTDIQYPGRIQHKGDNLGGHWGHGRYRRVVGDRKFVLGSCPPN